MIAAEASEAGVVAFDAGVFLSDAAPASPRCEVGRAGISRCGGLRSVAGSTFSRSRRLRRGARSSAPTTGSPAGLFIAAAVAPRRATTLEGRRSLRRRTAWSSSMLHAGRRRRRRTYQSRAPTRAAIRSQFTSASELGGVTSPSARRRQLAVDSAMATRLDGAAWIGSLSGAADVARTAPRVDGSADGHLATFARVSIE